MKIFKIIEHMIILIASLITIAAGSFAIYDLFKNKNPQLQISKIYSIKKNNNLYEIRFRIQNIGSQSILNLTQFQNLLNDKLKIEISNVKKIKKVGFISNFKVEDIKSLNNVIIIRFKQWMKNDYLDIIHLYEPIDENKSLEMNIDKYQILNGEIKHSLELYDDTPIIIINE